MKVLLCVNSYLPDIGGKELVVHQLATQFQALGHRVVVAGPGGVRKFRGFHFGYPVRRWPKLPGISREVSEYAAMVAARLWGGFDVVHAHTTYPNGYAAARTRRFSAAPLIVTPHGEDINVIPELGFGARMDPQKNSKIEFALGHAARATAISETIAASLGDAGVAASRIVRIPNGVDLERFRSKPAFDVTGYLGFPENSFLVVSIGNYHRRKGHEELVESVRIASSVEPSIRLAIVGRTSDELCRKVNDTGMADRVRFVGTLPVPMPGGDGSPDVLAALLRRAQAYVSASVGEGAEGLSLGLLEGMASGACPVVTSISGNRDVICHEGNGLLVAPGKPAVMAEALVRLVQNDVLRQRLRARARKFVADYGWRAVAQRYLDLYAEVCRP